MCQYVSAIRDIREILSPNATGSQLLHQETVDPCNPSPCGSNAICQRSGDAGACQCIPEYFGDPYVACRPECVVHSDCPSNKACQRNKCIDPCPGTCGINAQCRVMSHVATCTCIENYIGDPFTACKRRPLPVEPVVEEDPCKFISWLTIHGVPMSDTYKPQGY